MRRLSGSVIVESTRTLPDSRRFPAVIELAEIADDEDVWLHHRIDQIVGFPGLRQPDVKGSDVGAPALAFESQLDLVMQLPYQFLVEPRRSGWHAG